MYNDIFGQSSEDVQDIVNNKSTKRSYNTSGKSTKKLGPNMEIKLGEGIAAFMKG